ncbi:MAG: GNAT family N-acetyltransferase [Clostridiaceae bacterium]
MKYTLEKYNDKEYIIKDNVGINKGRIYFIENDIENRYVSFRLSLYKDLNRDEETIHYIIKNLLDSLIRSNIETVSVYCEEGILIYPLTNFGFIFNCYIEKRIKKGNNNFSREMLFTLDTSDYNVKNEEMLILKGESIELRLLNETYAEKLLDYYSRNKDHLMPFDPKRSQTFYTIENQEKSLRQGYLDYLNNSCAEFGIFKDNMLIGKIRISSIVKGVFNNAFVGYSIDKNMQNKGYMKEALKLVIDFSFNRLKLHRIEASALIDNIKSERVLLSCGFKRIGETKNYLFINGKWRDHNVFYILRDENKLEV